MANNIRVGFDLGTNSIGWVLVEIDENSWPVRVIASGVRIFSNSRNGKTLVPLTVERREARGARNRRDRLLMRKRSILKRINALHLLPDDFIYRENLKNLDPYQLRSEALDRVLTNEEVARVLFHFSQRRGFKSNRKDLKKEEGGKSLGAKISTLQQEIEGKGYRTLGEFLYKEFYVHQKPLRFRSEGEWYPSRRQFEDEFDLIAKTQLSLNSGVEEVDWDYFKKVLFFQRPLRKPLVGKCLFRPELSRGRRALVSFQRFRILQQLANLKIIELGKAARGLSEEEWSKLVKKLFESKELAFDKAREFLDLPDTAMFNVESSRTGFRAAKVLFGDATSKIMSGKKYFGKAWNSLLLSEKDSLVDFVIDSETDDEVRQHILSDFDLPQENAESICALSEENFEKAYCEFSKEVLQDLCGKMESTSCLSYDKAAVELGYHHSDFRLAERLSRLPYYGEVLQSSVVGGSLDPKEENPEKRWGKISNPTVHVALNQLRKVHNRLLDVYGHIDEVVVEVARDLPLGEQGLRQLKREVSQNESQNEAWDSKLRELGVMPSYKARLKLRLWEELHPEQFGRKCPYSGEIISISKLFSPEVEVDHILPRSRTFSNHHSNLILSMRHANKEKGDRSPYEAFSGPGSKFKYEDILSRASFLPDRKQRLFNPDAMEIYKDTEGFLERQLNDTRYISKVAGQYLKAVCPKVMVSRGRITAYIRSMLYLSKLISPDSKKTRVDHRHHAIDAFVLILSTPKTLIALDRMLRKDRPRDFESLSEPLAGLVAQFAGALKQMIVSHKVDHGENRRFFTETAYGALPDGRLRTRKSPEAVGSRSEILDKRIGAFVASSELKKTDLNKAVEEEFGAKKVRVAEKDATAIKLTHPKDTGRFEKMLLPAENVCLEFWMLPGINGKLISEAFTPIEVAQKVQKKPHPAARKLFSLYKGDTLRLEDSGKVRTVVVESLRVVSGRILFSDHNISENANEIGRYLTFGAFERKKARRVYVDEIGQVFDPGFWWSNDSSNSRNSISGEVPQG